MPPNGLEKTYSPEEVVNTVTVDMVVEELGTLIDTLGNEFPTAQREATLARWIEEDGQEVLGDCQMDKNVHREGLTGYQRSLLVKAIVHRVCWRALKRIFLNRTPESGGFAIAAATKSFESSASMYILKLDYSLNGAKEYLDETDDHMPLPVADAGPDQDITSGETVTFDGSKSYNHRGIKEYYWNFVYDGTEQNLTGVSPTFVFITPGEYEVRLRVTDYDGDESEYDRMTVTVV